MPDYAAQIPPHDRWAIVAYIRALQLSQTAPATFVPAGTQLRAPAPAVQSDNLGAAPGQPKALEQQQQPKEKQGEHK